MIGIDTSVLARYFAQDDPLQSPIASALEGLSPARRGYVPSVALVELVWVMTRRFGIQRGGIVELVEVAARPHHLSAHLPNPRQAL